eukprot:883875-Pyramimonas_sp.AAC.1
MVPCQPGWYRSQPSLSAPANYPGEDPPNPTLVEHMSRTARCTRTRWGGSKRVRDVPTWT